MSKIKEYVNINWWKCLLLVFTTIIFICLGISETLDLREIASNYEFGFPWGMLFKRLTLILLVYLFVVANLVFDIKTLWEWIYRKRWWIALVLFIFFVLNKYNFSSMHMYDVWIQTNQGDQYSFPVFGQARAIRSDEIWVDLPRFLSAEYEDYGKLNNIVRATETSNLSASGLQMGYAALAEPEKWGFYLFGSEYGLAWMWSFKMIFGLLFVFETCMIISKNNRLISLFGAVLIHFSQYNMWWSMRYAWLWCGCAAIYFFYKFMHEDKYLRRCVYGGITAIFVANFCVNLYPAWQVPSAYVYLALVIWIIIEAKEKWKKYKSKDILLVCVCVVFAISMVVAYVYGIWDYIIGIMNTVYPGNRCILGGFSITDLFRSYYSALTPYITDVNPCEKSCFYCVFPLGFILSTIVLIKKKGKSLLLWMLTVPMLFLLWYCITPLPEWLAKITLMTYSSYARAIDIVGFISCLMIIISMAELKKLGGLKNWISAIIVVVNVLIPFMYEIYLGATSQWIIVFAVMMLLTGLIQFVMIADVNERIKNSGVVLLTIFVLFTGLSVHPLMSGTSVITSKPLAKEVQKIVEEDPDGKWIAVNERAVQNYLIACGAPTYNSVNYVPNMELWSKIDPEGQWEEIYNRYAHIMIFLVEGESSVALRDGAADCIQLNLSYDALEKLDVTYILSPVEIDTEIHNNFKLIETDMDQYYIYEIR